MLTYLALLGPALIYFIPEAYFIIFSFRTCCKSPFFIVLLVDQRPLFHLKKIQILLFIYPYTQMLLFIFSLFHWFTIHSITFPVFCWSNQSSTCPDSREGHKPPNPSGKRVKEFWCKC